jgi:HlyD family secretion protein
VSPLVTVQVGSQVSGRVQQLFVDFNSPVESGQLVAKIDPQLFEAARAQAKANFVAAEGNLAKAKFQAVDARRQAKRSQELVRRNLIAQADADTSVASADAAEAAVKAAEGAVEQAKASLKEAEVNLAYTDIVSPTNGVVVSRSVDVGQTVAASLQAPVLFTIAEDLHKMQVDTSVAEADVGKLRPGMAATFRVDAYPNDRFTGTVRQIRDAPQTVQNVVTYDAVIDVANPDLKLKPGMTANVTFVYDERDQVLAVPNAALRFRAPKELVQEHAPEHGMRHRGAGGAGRTPAGDALAAQDGGENSERRSVWVLRDGEPQPVAVKTGVTDGSTTEILSGEVNENDDLIVEATGGAAAAARGIPMAPPGGMRRVF